MKTLKEYNSMEYNDLVIEFENTKNINVMINGAEYEIGVAFREWWDYNEESGKDFVDSGYVFSASLRVGENLGVDLCLSNTNDVKEFIKELQREYKEVVVIS